MSNLTSTLINGNLSVTGDIYGSGQCFLVDSSDSSAFSKMVTAYQANKTIILRAAITVSGATMNVIVPLSRVDVNSSTGNIIQFTFSKAREYGDYPGVVDVWWSTASSNGFVYDDPPATTYKATYAASALHSDTATSTAGCSGNATQANTCTGFANGTAGRATYDNSGNKIDETYFTKNEVRDITGWMFSSTSSYNKYSFDGTLFDYGTLTNSDSHYFDRIMATAGYAHSVYYVGTVTGEQMMVPGHYNWKTWVKYRFSVTNIGSNTLTVKIVAGGRWGSVKRSGTIFVDGYSYTSDSSIESWADGMRNQRVIGTLPINSRAIWEIFWYMDTKTFPSPTGEVDNEIVYVTTVRT